MGGREMTTIAVVADYDKKGYWKVLNNYIQYGVVLSDMTLANNSAIALSKNIHCDHLILARADA
jgi:hypothetical protein